MMNWALFALSNATVMTAIWIFLLIKSRRSLAIINSVAPIRGYIDRDYVGYGFGLLHASKGLSVTFVAGSVLLVSVVAGFLAARNRASPMM